MSSIHFEALSPEQLSKLLPAYEFSHLISLDESSAIFHARHRSLDRDVAIKFLTKAICEDPLFQVSFFTVTRQMARLSDKNLIAIHDYGNADGMLYTAMEYVHGKSLRHSTRGKMIDPRQAVRIALAICDGLVHAHENGIVHRNLRPSKILLDENGEPKIGGFGLTSPTESSSSYSAPRTISDHAGKGHRLDVYSVGVILKEMLTGFPAETAAFEYAAVNDPSLARICATAMAVDPALRYADPDRLRQTLGDWQQATPTATAQIASIVEMPLPQRSLASA
jgi:serine/threonine protein kinase